MALTFGFWCPIHSGGWDRREATDLQDLTFEEAKDVSLYAEGLGFDSVWLTEHHFVDDGYMPSLLAVAAAVAARTERIEIGTGLLLAPLHDPVRLAEDAATVDLLSHGRLLLGLGMGWRVEEFEVLGIPMSERRTRLIDAVAILRQSWGDALVTGTKRRRYPGVSVRRGLGRIRGGSPPPYPCPIQRRRERTRRHSVAICSHSLSHRRQARNELRHWD